MKPVATKHSLSGHAFFLILLLLVLVFCSSPPVFAQGVGLSESHVLNRDEQQRPDENMGIVQVAQAGTTSPSSDELGNVTEEEAGAETTEPGHIADPLESMNRFFFKFNDKFYFWVFRPAATGYKKVVSEDFRVLFSNFYKNLSSPVRIVNKLLQMKPGDAGIEMARLVINSTLGVGGLRDCANECFGVRMRDADFGQTLGYYGVGQGFYLVWPFLGPSSARDSIGYGGDYLLYPTTWYASFSVSVGMRAHEKVNILSFHLGDYEALKKAAIDPYVSLRNAYIQNREAFVAEARGKKGDEKPKEPAQGATQ